MYLPYILYQAHGGLSNLKHPRGGLIRQGEQLTISFMFENREDIHIA